MTTNADLLAVYEARLRGEAEMGNTVRRQRIGPVHAGEFDSRGTGFVSYSSLDGLGGEVLDDLIASVVAYFRQGTNVTEFEWKTRGHDAPDDLPERLLAHGFVADELETVMLGSASTVADGISGEGLSSADHVVIREVGTGSASREADLAAALALQEEVFGHPAGSLDDALRNLDAQPETMSFWVADAGGRVVSAGRLSVVEGTDVAGIWGGVTHPEWCGHGIYRALTAARARWGIERGVRYLHSDSTEFSRPILERSGLQAVTTTTPYIWTR